MNGRIDDIKFYNHVTTVYQSDKKPVPDILKPKSHEETLPPPNRNQLALFCSQ